MVSLLIHELSKMGSCNLIYEIEKGPQTIARVNCPNGLSGFGDSLNSFETVGVAAKNRKADLVVGLSRLVRRLSASKVTVLTPVTTTELRGILHSEDLLSIEKC